MKKKVITTESRLTTQGDKEWRYRVERGKRVVVSDYKFRSKAEAEREGRLDGQEVYLIIFLVVLLLVQALKVFFSLS